MYIIYKLTSPSNKYYIGWTSKSLNWRLQRHKSEANMNRRFTKIYMALRKYPLEQWKKEIIFKSNNLEESLEKEQYYININNSIKNGYNISIGGEFGALGCKRTKIFKEKLRIINLGNKYRIGKFHSQNTKKLIGEKNSLNWKIITPEKNELIIKNLREFCRNNNLNASNMIKIADKKYRFKSCKGFKCERLVA